MVESKKTGKSRIQTATVREAEELWHHQIKHTSKKNTVTRVKE